MIYMVSGGGRSGTSMAMQAAKAGGLSTGRALGPYYEDERATSKLPEYYDWLSYYDHKVIKIFRAEKFLPHEILDDLGLSVRILWMERDDVDEQAKSWRKFLTYRGYQEEVEKTTHEAMKQTIHVESGVSKGYCLELDPKMVVMKFEDALEDPMLFGEALKEWADSFKGFDANAAIGVVRPRETKCLDYILEEEL